MTLHSSTWVVIAAYNEEPAIAEVVREVRARFPNVVVVDDGSIDQTRERAHRAGATVLRHPINLGQGAALQTGISYALGRGAQLIATLDGDGQHRADDVSRMIDALQRSRADVALGSRFLGDAVGLPWKRRVMLKAAVAFTLLTAGLKLSDTHNGLRVFTRTAAETLDIRQDGMAHASEIIGHVASEKLRYVEVPVTIRYTDYSLRKGQRMSNLFKILGELITGRLRR